MFFSNRAEYSSIFGFYCNIIKCYFSTDKLASVPIGLEELMTDVIRIVIFVYINISI